MSENKPPWFLADSKFGYSPFINRRKGFEVVSSNEVEKYVISNKFFSREWRVHMFTSCTSLLMLAVLRGHGIHLGDGGGYGPKDEVGWFEPASTYAKDKQDRTALLAHGDGGYIAAIKSQEPQTEYLKSVKAFILSERKKRSIKVVVVPWMLVVVLLNLDQQRQEELIRQGNGYQSYRKNNSQMYSCMMPF